MCMVARRAFQSTHPRGVRRTSPRLASDIGIYFNPRTREGCDLYFGTTISRSLDFNPRTREGCDDRPYRGTIRRMDFNPRTREGCDPLAGSRWPRLRPDFNPRTREGCDVHKGMQMLGLRVISIHAPARGATVFLSLSRAFFIQLSHFLAFCRFFVCFFVRRSRRFSVQPDLSKHQ